MLRALCKFYARLYVWGPRGVVKKQWKILWKFCKKILRKHRYAENRVAELELQRDSQRKGVVDDSEELSAYVTNGWSADSYKFRNPFFFNTVLSHWVFVAQFLDQWHSKIRPVHGLETLHNKHPIREHNIQEQILSTASLWKPKNSHSKNYNWQGTNLHIASIIQWE